MTAEAPVCREVTVNLENGLHLVPCSQIVEHVRDFPGTVQIRLDNKIVDAKSILDLMTLRAECGTILVLQACGQGAAAIIDGLAEMFERNFKPQ